jgi:CBS domain-containing protein
MPHHTHGSEIREVMNSNPRTVEPGATVQEAARLFRDEDVGSLPIVEGNRLVGTITDRDVVLRVVAEGKDPQSVVVGDVATTDLVTVEPQQNLDEALRLMAKHQVRRLPVVEEGGRLVGIVAQADVAQEADAARVGETVEEISQ